MASTYSPILRTELIANGEQSGTWGTTTNLNLGTLMEAAIAGTANVAMPAGSADYTLTAYNGLTDEARAHVLNITGALTANRNVIIPAVSKTYLVHNATTGAYTITLKTASSTGILVPQGSYAWVYCSGTTVSNVGGGAAGGGGATGGGTDSVFVENDKVVTTNYTIGSNAYISGVAISNATPAVCSLANHGFVASSQVHFSTTGGLPTGLAVDTVYYVLAAGLTSGAFEVSLTDGGAAINTSSAGSGVHSIAKIKNAVSAGPVTVVGGVVVTIPSGSSWSIV